MYVYLYTCTCAGTRVDVLMPRLGETLISQCAKAGRRPEEPCKTQSFVREQSEFPCQGFFLGFLSLAMYEWILSVPCSQWQHSQCQHSCEWNVLHRRGQWELVEAFPHTDISQMFCIDLASSLETARHAGRLPTNCDFRVPLRRCSSKMASA